jgi:DNA repair protein RadC
MRIIQYKTQKEKDTDLTVLVKERGFIYNGNTNGLNAPQMIYRMMEDLFQLSIRTEEYLYMISLNTVNKPLGIFEITHGTVNTTIASPREIFLKALLAGAVSIILIHNHPSGSVKPSKEDLDFTNRIKEVGNLMNVRLLDHIIIGEETYTSLKEEGIL